MGADGLLDLALEFAGVEGGIEEVALEGVAA
jgi:hypothetical protein